MSKWDVLKFDDIIIDDTKNAIKVKKEDYLEKGLYPVIDQGQNQVAGYRNIKLGLYKDIPAIIFGDHTRVIKYIDTPFFLGADGVKLLKSKKNNVDYKYLYYFFIKNEIQNTGYNRHFKWLKELQIPLPPLETQKQIAETLDTATELLALRKQQLIELDNLIKSSFYNMFGDPIVNDKRWTILNFKNVATIDTKMTKDFEKYAKYPHIGIDSIEKGTGAICDYKLVKDSNIISGKYLFSDRHIIYSKIRPNLNKVALPTFYGLCSADAYPILPNDTSSNKYYLAYMLRSDFFLNYILDFSGRTNIPKVNKQQLEGFQLPVPPLSLQTQFAEIVTKIEEQKTLVKKAIEESQHLFDSLMSEYFE